MSGTFLGKEEESKEGAIQRQSLYGDSLCFAMDTVITSVSAFQG